MGANLTKEYSSTWEQDDVKKWKEAAKDLLKSYYLSFRGSQWDEYLVGTDDELLLRAKICFSVFGPPTVPDAEEIWNGYKIDQIDNAKEILNTILSVHKEHNGSKDKLLVGIVFVACKQDAAEYSVPIFRIFTGFDPHKASAPCCYVDTQKRVYSSWERWKSYNNMPMLKYAYPRLGYFTCSTFPSYSFDENKVPDIEFGSSPACDVSSRIFGTTDVVAGVTSFACGAIGVASMFTPIGPAILLTSAIAGGGSAVYGAGRAVVRIADKTSHGESLSDLESFTLYFSIAATPLHFATSFVNGAIVRGAVQNGRIFTPTMRMFATVLNFSTLGVDGVMIGFGVANLVDKYKRDQLSSIDVLQFSMSVFFFTNTLIQPKTASSIIKNAQDSHIQAYATNLNDAETQQTFNRFLDQNKGDGSIKDTSKIIRTINKINDPNALFKGLKDSSSINIGGRKGKTLMVSDKNNTVNRIRPNATAFSTGAVGTHAVSIQAKTTKCLKKIKSDDIDVNGNEVFKNMTDGEKARANRAIGGSAANNDQIVMKAVDISRDMGLKSVDDVLSIVEILAAQLHRDNPNTPMKEVTSFHLKAIDNKKFIAAIQNDISIAMKIAENNKLKFREPLLAVYHYYKHGNDFPAVLKSHNIEIYLTKVPSTIVKDANLTSIQTINGPDGSSYVEKIYITPQDQFAVVTESFDGTQLNEIIKTIYQKGNAYMAHLAKCPTEKKWHFDFIEGIKQRITSLGFPVLGLVFININDDRFKLLQVDEK